MGTEARYRPCFSAAFSCCRRLARRCRASRCLTDLRFGASEEALQVRVIPRARQSYPTIERVGRKQLFDYNLPSPHEAGRATKLGPQYLEVARA